MDNKSRVNRLKRQGLAYALMIMLSGAGLSFLENKAFLGVSLFAVSLLVAWIFMLRLSSRALLKELLQMIGFLGVGSLFMVSCIIIFNHIGMLQHIKYKGLLAIGFTLTLVLVCAVTVIRLQNKVLHNWDHQNGLYDEYALDDKQGKQSWLGETSAILASLFGIRFTEGLSQSLADRVAFYCYIIASLFFLSYGVRSLLNLIVTIRMERKYGVHFRDRYLLLLKHGTLNEKTSRFIPPKC